MGGLLVATAEEDRLSYRWHVSPLRPELKNVEPFKTVLSGNREAMAKLSMPDLEKILAATLTGMTVEDFNAEAKKWLEAAKHPRWSRPYTELTISRCSKCCATCATTPTRPTS
jgi:hypothetical protein